MTTIIMTAYGPRVCVCELGAGQSELGAETLVRETAEIITKNHRWKKG